jgi:hypothetical protein
VVARSLSRRLPLFRMVSPGPKQERECNLAPKLLLIQSFLQRN